MKISATSSAGLLDQLTTTGTLIISSSLKGATVYSAIRRLMERTDETSCVTGHQIRQYQIHWQHGRVERNGHAHMFAQDVALGRHDRLIRIDPKADRAIRKRRWNAVANALEADQTCGRDTLAVLDKTIESRRQLHQGCPLFSPDVSNATRVTSGWKSTSLRMSLWCKISDKS